MHVSYSATNYSFDNLSITYLLQALQLTSNPTKHGKEMLLVSGRSSKKVEMS